MKIFSSVLGGLSLGSIIFLLACTGEMRSIAYPPISKEAQSMLGVYKISGQDAHGTYTGQAEIYEGTPGKVVVAFIQDYDDLEYQGYLVSRAWEGTLQVENDRVSLIHELDQSGYVVRVGEDERPYPPPVPLQVTASLAKNPTAQFSVKWMANGVELGRESWSRTGEGIPQKPIWQNLRRRIAAHVPPSAERKSYYWNLFASFRTLEEVKPYVQHPDFNAAVHYEERDPTDYEYYQTNSKRIRIIQKTLRPTSMHEALRRRKAYALKLHEKEALVAKIMNRSAGGKLINTQGMVVYGDGSPNVDSLLWTGTFVASQALRYLLTGSENAYADMLVSLDGVRLCHTITNQPGQFARTLRSATTALTSDQRTWQRGEGPYSGIEWLSGGNNDMVKGFFVAFSAAVLALKKHGGEESRLADMKNIMSDLIDNNTEVFGNTTGAVNKGTGLLLIAILTNDPLEKMKALAEYQLLLPVMRTSLELSAQYDNGITDWSGNNLHATTLWPLYILTEQLQHSSRRMITELAVESHQRLGHLRNGFVREVFSILGWPAGQRPKDFVWDLREFLVPKIADDEIDWRRSYGFTLSPYPSLPWKADWMTDDRVQPLVNYPYFEQVSSNHQWKSLPEFRGTPTSMGFFAVDYLIAYWFGRYAGEILPGD